MIEPAQLAARPHHGRFPIPFITHVREDGRPDFRVQSIDARKEVAERNLCQLCGEPLKDFANFVGFTSSVMARSFGEPPMHPNCASYALLVCPFLAGGNEWRPFAADPHHYVVLEHPETAPRWMAVVLVREWSAYPDFAEGSGSVKWRTGAPAGRIRWHDRLSVQTRTP